MPAPEHYRLTFAGIFGTVAQPIEDWSFGVSLSEEVSPFLVTSDLPGIAQSMANHWTALSASINAVARLTTVRLALIDTNGKYKRDANGAMMFGEYSTDLPGTAPDALTKPLQVSLAATLRTSLDAPYGRGRFYLPAPEGGALNGDGTIADAPRDVIQNRVGTFLINVRDTWNTAAGGSLVVASSGSALRGVAPALRRVTGVYVGRRYDIQRRRAADISEDVQPAMAL